MEDTINIKQISHINLTLFKKNLKYIDRKWFTGWKDHCGAEWIKNHFHRRETWAGVGFSSRKEKSFKTEGNNLSFVFLIKISKSRTPRYTQVKQFEEHSKRDILFLKLFIKSHIYVNGTYLPFSSIKPSNLTFETRALARKEK